MKISSIYALEMNFDGVNPTRPSVHERLGTFDVTTASKEKKVCL